MESIVSSGDAGRQAVVAGGGVAGLAAGIALAQTGWRVSVFERAEALEAVGAGVQISPNGSRCLARLGAMAHLRGAFEPEAIELRLGASGRRMFHLPLREKAQARWGGPYLHVHRADLIEALRLRLAELAPDALRLGVAVTGYTNRQALLEDGTTVDCDLLVGADGIHSALRSQMHSPQQPRFTGNVAWRTTVPVDRLTHVPPPVACIWTGAGRHAVTTRIDGGDTVNFVGVVEQDGWHEEGWSIPGERADALDAFKGFAPPVRDVLEQCDSLNRWALLDRAPLPFWHDGTTVLVGDAAHPMLPSLAQGAVQSLEDAVTLADALAGAPPVKALPAFYDARIGRVTKVQRQSAGNVRLFHRHNAVSQTLTYGPMAVATALLPGFVRGRNDWLFGGGPS